MLYAPQAIETIVKELGHIEPALVRVEQSVALGGLMTRLDEVSTVLDISTEGIWPTPFHIKRCLCAVALFRNFWWDATSNSTPAQHLG